MPEDRQIDVAIWNATEDERAAELAGHLEAGGLNVFDLDLARTDPMVVLLLPGNGGPDFASTCTKIVEAYPNAPAVVLHTSGYVLCSPAAGQGWGFYLGEVVYAVLGTPAVVLLIGMTWLGLVLRGERASRR